MVAYADTQPLSDQQMLNVNKNSHKYDIDFGNKLSSGGFGTVWQVECRLKNSPSAQSEVLACKVIKPVPRKIPGTIEVMRMLLTDINMGMKLSWLAYRDTTEEGYTPPNLIRYLDVIAIPDDQTHFPFSALLILMPMCQGDLNTILTNFFPQSIPHLIVQRWMKQISGAVSYMHQHDIVHLDIKPGNILVKFADPTIPLTRLTVAQHLNTIQFLLTDFGCARMHLHSEGQVTTEKVGTETYMSPELSALKLFTSGTPILTKPCDVYALGVSMFRCRTKVANFALMIQSKRVATSLLNLNKSQIYVKHAHPIEVQANDLIGNMTIADPNSRLTIDQVLQHPYFTTVAPAQPVQPNP